MTDSSSAQPTTNGDQQYQSNTTLDNGNQTQSSIPSDGVDHKPPLPRFGAPKSHLLPPSTKRSHSRTRSPVSYARGVEFAVLSPTDYDTQSGTFTKSSDTSASVTDEKP
ncbi:unnamed protein product [Rotaria sp. Silwood1]|nr:unnamed protein product [Rotaria sp. Silwood1]CAF4668443.1 unnamed protein product [Rotaria sp. Silwood1]